MDLLWLQELDGENMLKKSRKTSNFCGYRKVYKYISKIYWGVSARSMIVRKENEARGHQSNYEHICKKY